MGKQSYKSVANFSFGEVTTEVKPSADFKDQTRAMDAILVAAHAPLTAWSIDYTFDPGTKGGRQEQITTELKDGSRKIADLVISIPTTSNYPQAMFENLVRRTIVPQAERAAAPYLGTTAGKQPSQASTKSPLQEHLSTGIEETSRVRPRELMKR